MARVKQIALPNMSEAQPISWRPECKEKGDLPQSKREFFLPNDLGIETSAFCFLPLDSNWNSDSFCVSNLPAFKLELYRCLFCVLGLRTCTGTKPSSLLRLQLADSPWDMTASLNAWAHSFICYSLYVYIYTASWFSFSGEPWLTHYGSGKSFSIIRGTRGTQKTNP